MLNQSSFLTFIILIVLCSAASGVGKESNGAYGSDDNQISFATEVSRLAAQQMPSLMSFGALCDDKSDDSDAILRAISSKLRISIPAGRICKASRIGWSSLHGVFIGPGRIRTSDGNLRAHRVSTLLQEPALLANWNSDLTSWNGDLNSVGSTHEHIIRGATTLGEPKTNYLLIPETFAELASVYNDSGQNISKSSNKGRTGSGFRHTRILQYGQGDLTGEICSGVVASKLSGATHYLASPAIECFGGELFGGVDGSYIEFLGDMTITDNGFDIAAVGIENNFNRTSAREALGTNWVGRITQSTGTMPLDALDRASGPYITGIDMSSMSMGYHRLATYSLVNGGSGFFVGDLLTVKGGDPITPTKFRVKAVEGSSITSLTVENTGIYKTPPIKQKGPLSISSAAGKHILLVGQYDADTSILLPVKGGCIKAAQNIGSPVSGLSGISTKLCITPYGASIGGYNNTIEGNSDGYAVQLGNDHHSNGMNNIQIGIGTSDNGLKNCSFFSSGEFDGRAGSSQEIRCVLRGATSSSVILTTDGAIPSQFNMFKTPLGSSQSLSVRMLARNVITGDTAAWKARSIFVARRDNGEVNFRVDPIPPPDFATGQAQLTKYMVNVDSISGAISILFSTPPGETEIWHAQATLVADHVR